MILQNDKIKLRPIEPEDLDILYIWENDTTLWHVSNTLTPFSQYILKQYISESHRDIYEAKQVRFIIENEHNVPIGAVDLYDFNPKHRRAGIGILIYDANERSKGYASDAIDLTCQYAKETIGMHQVFAYIGASNTSSIQLFEKLKFEQTGCNKDWLKTPSGWEDELVYQRIL